MNQKAVLALSDGSVFHGRSFGSDGTAIGELVFNTAMTGYQEIVSDPSYAEQLVTLTYPHIGNVGCNEKDLESTRCYAKALIVRNAPTEPSNWRSQMSLPQFLKSQSVLAISGVDTRYITHLLRQKGALSACISTELSEDEAINKAKSFAGLSGANLAKQVSTETTYQHTFTGEHSGAVNKPLSLVAYDFGVKKQILDLFCQYGFEVTVVPYATPYQDVLAMNPDGVFLSNGPGDPAACDIAIDNAKGLFASGIPLFGICLGFQIMALALGASSYKMKFGHHGANHPVVSVNTGRQVMISSQNHGFAVDEKTLPSEAVVTHRSLFDNSLQGFQFKNTLGFQGHPEASPGPHDLEELFQHFYTVCDTSEALALEP